MNIHVWLLSLALLIPGCIAVLSQLRRASRSTGYPFLPPLTCFVSATILVFLIHFIPTYIYANLPGVWSEISGIGSGLIWIVLSVVICLIGIAGTFCFIKVIQGFREGKKLLWAELFLLMIAASLLIAGFLHCIFPSWLWIREAFVFIKLYVMRYLNLFYVLLLILLLRYQKNNPDSPYSALSGSFAMIMLIREGVDFMVTFVMDYVRIRLNADFADIGVIGDMIYLVLTIFLIYFWLIRFLMPAAEKGMDKGNHDAAVAAWVRSGLISEEEGEMVRWIVEGKSNKEIGVLMNHTSSAVKNHIYKLYRKMEINSRFELIERIKRLQ